MATLVLFLISYPLGLYTMSLLITANIVGMMRKAGTPEFNIAYLQRIIFTEDFQTMCYAMSISLTTKGLFLMTPVLISAVMTLAFECKKELDTKPSTPIISIPQVKNYILKGASAEL